MMIRAIQRVTLAAAVAVVLAAGTASAQQPDVRDLGDRIDRLERDLNILQSQFYRSQSSGSGNAATPSAGAANPVGAPLSGDVYNTLDQRIAALEDQLRTLTGAVEKANHDSAELSNKLDRVQADNDVRFKELEQKASGAAPAASPTPGQATAPAALTPPAETANAGADQAGAATPKSAEEWNPTQGSAPHPLGQIKESDLKRLEPKNADAANAAAASARTPQEQYDAAFAQLRNNDNDGAAKSFQAFLDQHPKDPLAGNATFWLGQIAYSQGKFEQAAPIFFEAYSKYPKSAKAGESLLKVGLAMSNLGKKKEACAALARFGSEFPDASDSLKRQSGAEKQKLGCGG
jgi:tol-pal system protein YbgF